MLSGRGLCDELITRPEESFRLLRVVVCDLETSKDESKSPLKCCEYKPTMGCDSEKKKKVTHSYILCACVRCGVPEISSVVRDLKFS